MIGASTVSEWVQNLGYEEAKLVRVVENDKGISNISYFLMVVPRGGSRLNFG